MWTELGRRASCRRTRQQLRDELDQRGLKVCGGTVFAGLHKGKEALDKAIAEFSQEAKLLTEVGAKYLVHLPEQYTDMHTGAATESGDLDPEQWKNLVTGTNELGRVIFEEYGVELVFHPHADTHVDTQDRILQFLDDTDPQYVNLCLDTGHVAYCGGDNLQIIEQAPERITYVHLKFVDPQVRRTGPAGEAVAGRGRAAGHHGRTALRRTRRYRRCWTRWPRWTGTSSPSSSRTCTRSRPTSRWPSRPAPPATSPPSASARSAAGRTDRCVVRRGPQPLIRKAFHVTVNVGVIGVGMIGQDHIRAPHPGFVGGQGQPGSPMWTSFGPRTWWAKSPAPSSTSRDRN